MKIAIEEFFKISNDLFDRYYLISECSNFLIYICGIPNNILKVYNGEIMGPLKSR